MQPPQGPGHSPGFRDCNKYLETGRGYMSGRLPALTEAASKLRYLRLEVPRGAQLDGELPNGDIPFPFCCRKHDPSRPKDIFLRCRSIVAYPFDCQDRNQQVRFFGNAGDRERCLPPGHPGLDDRLENVGIEGNCGQCDDSQGIKRELVHAIIPNRPCETGQGQG